MIQGLFNASTMSDLLFSFSNWRTWGMLGWNDVQQRYRRSAIGPFWITLSMAVFVAALGVVYAKLFRIDVKNYIPFLTTGYLVWIFVATLVQESCGVFVESEGIIKQIRVPLPVFVLRMMWRNILVFLHSLPIYVVIVAFFPVPLAWATLLALPGFLLVCLNAFWVSLLLGMLCVRFRDVPLIVQSVVQIVFFITPIFWQPEMLGAGSFLVLVDANPVYHVVDLVRSPLLGKSPALLSYVFVIGMIVIGWLVAIATFHRYRNRVAYWL